MTTATAAAVHCPLTGIRHAETAAWLLPDETACPACAQPLTPHVPAPVLAAWQAGDNSTRPNPIPRRVRDYFPGEWPAVTATFTPETGWTLHQPRPITTAYARQLRRAGVTAVQVTSGHRAADFQTTELIPMTGLKG